MISSTIRPCKYAARIVTIPFEVVDEKVLDGVSRPSYGSNICLDSADATG